MAANTTVPVTALEVLSEGRVLVTAEFPHKAMRGWVKVQYYRTLADAPTLGAAVKVTIE